MEMSTSDVDAQFERLCYQIRTAQSRHEWLCPRCGTSLVFQFQSRPVNDGTTTRSSLGVACRNCGMQMEMDGDFEIPAWYTPRSG